MDGIASMMQMMQQQQVLVGPKDRPSHYKTVADPQVTFQAQANDLTPTDDVQLKGRVQVIAANEALYDQWKAVAAAKKAGQDHNSSGAVGQAAGPATMPLPRQSIPVQMSGEHVSVTHLQAQQPLVKVEQGRITGDKSVIQSYAAADRLYQMEASYLGRDIKFPTSDGKLQVQVGDVSTMESGPTHNGGRILIPLGDDNSARDADVISHEGGHAVLRSQRPDYGTRLPLVDDAVALHEGFADSTALIASLHDKNVRADVIEKRKQGTLSNLASNQAEGASRQYDAEEHIDWKQPPPKPGEMPAMKRVEPDARHGLRDAADAPPQPGKAEKGRDGTEEPHDASRRFSSGFYRSVLDISDSLKQKDPRLSDDEALKRATDIAGKDLARASDFLPILPQGGKQDDLARAVVTADRRDHGGEYGDIYQRNFGAAGLQAEPKAEAGGAGSVHLSQGLAAAKPFVVAEGARKPVAGSGRAVADQFLKDNAQALGLEKGVPYRAQQMVHNDQGETFITWSNGSHAQDEAATRFVRLGFDRDGQVIHDSRAQLPKFQPPAPGTDAPAPWGARF